MNKMIQLALALSLYGCDQNISSLDKRKPKKCLYTLNDLSKAKIIKNQYLDKDSNIVVDELINEIGSRYIFNKNGILIKYMYMTSIKSFSYLEDFENNEIIGSPILNRCFVENDSGQIEYHIQYFDLFKSFDLKLIDSNESIKISINKSNRHPNQSYSTILCYGYNINSIYKYKLILKGKIINCRDTINVCDTIIPSASLSS